MTTIWGFIDYTSNVHFQSEDFIFTFDENLKHVSKKNNAFLLTKYNSDDEDHGIMISVDYYKSIELVEISQEEFNDKYGDNDNYDFFNWGDLWEKYQEWLDELKLEVYDEYDISCFQVIEESEEIKERLSVSSHGDFSKMFLNNDEELIKVWNMCSSATKVTFPEEFAQQFTNRHFSVETIKFICLNDRVKEIIFDSYQLENIFRLLENKTGLVKAKFETIHATYNEIMRFINNNKSTLEDLELDLTFPETTYEELTNIINLIKANICSYCVTIGYCDVDDDRDRGWKNAKSWCKSQGGSIEWGYGTDDESFTFEFSS